MNKKVILILIVLVIGVTLSLFFFNKNDNSSEVKEKKLELNDYEYDVYCRYDYEVLSEDDYPYYSNVYITYNKGGDITRVVYQNVTETDFGDSYMSLINDIYDLYNDVDGIRTDIYKSDGYVVTEVDYDFTSLDLSDARDELEDILEDDSFILTGKLPMDYNKYINEYLSEYSCEVK